MARVACVTGASAGIGAEFARELARRGYDLALVARRRERLDALGAELAAQYGVRAEALAADLIDPVALEAVAARLGAAPPDLLVNNAGFGSAGRFAELSPVRELDQVRVLVLAVVRLTHAVLPGMLARRSGAIVNVSSLAGEGAGPFNATYAASKAFVTSFSEALHEETRGSGVRVMALLPGFTRTEFQAVAGVDPSAIPAQAWLDPGEVARTALADLERGAARSIPGASYRLVAAAQALAPRGLVRRLTGAVWRRAHP
jgi:short-subunit dehydrogenase